MNRTVLIVICDFLLLMLVASARFDEVPAISPAMPDRIMGPNERMQVRAAAAAEADPGTLPPRTAELLEVMKSSLEEERLSREALAARLAEARGALEAQERLAGRQAEDLDRARQEALAKDAERQRLEQERKALAAEFTEAQSQIARIQRELETTALESRLSQQRLAQVERQYAAAQTNVVRLEKQVSTTDTEARLARERLAQLEADLKARQNETEQARQRIEQVERLRQTAEIERERIVGELKVAESQKQMTEAQLEAAKGQIAVVQEEKAQIQKVTADLAGGVAQFAERQGELTREIRENRPLTANSIFSEFLTNRVSTDFRANRGGLFGRTVSNDLQTRTILASDGTQTFAIFHLRETPFRFDEYFREWESFFVRLYRGGAILPLAQIHFLSADPRVIAAPVTEAQARQLGVRVYQQTADPLRFQDALLIGADEAYYGECKFTVDPRHTGYLKMERSVLGKLAGKFNPSAGDLVFSKSGELIGMMVNKQYCALLSSFVPSATIPTGTRLNSEAIGSQLAAMQSVVRGLPLEMQ